MLWEGIPADVPAKYVHPEFNHEKVSDQLHLREILQNNWPVVLESIQVMKIKKTLRTVPEWKGTAERDPFTLC